MLKRTLTPLAAVLGLLCAANAQAENLIDIYRAALQNDPQYLASGARSEASKEGIAQARSALLPQISGSLTKTRRDSESSGTTAFGSVVVNNESESVSNSQGWSLDLTQSIYRHDNWIALSQAEKRAKQAEYGFLAEQQGLMVRASEAYFNVLAAQDGLELAQAELKAIGQQLEQTKQRFNVGLIAITDVHEAQARYDQAQANLISAQNTLDNNNESLRQITGGYYDALSRLKAELPLASPEPAVVDDWVKVARDQNLSLMAQRLGVDVAREEIKRQGAGHLPSASVTLGASGGDSDGHTDAPNDSGVTVRKNTAGDNSDASIRFSISVPIFSGGRTSSLTRQAEHQFVETSQNMEQQHRKVVRDARSAFLGVNAAMTSVKALQQAEISAQSALEATQAGFEVGTRTIVDVLQATSNLYSAKRNLWRARYDYVLNILRLKSAAGTLTEDDVARVNSWLN